MSWEPSVLKLDGRRRKSTNLLMPRIFSTRFVFLLSATAANSYNFLTVKTPKNITTKPCSLSSAFSFKHCIIALNNLGMLSLYVQLQYPDVNWNGNDVAGDGWGMSWEYFQDSHQHHSVLDVFNVKDDYVSSPNSVTAVSQSLIVKHNTGSESDCTRTEPNFSRSEPNCTGSELTYLCQIWT